ncbi:hypothetical protein BHE74_00027591, partial [Ensete ventricosum]
SLRLFGITKHKLLHLAIFIVQQVCQQLHSLWSAPFRITISVILLYQQLGIASLVGAFVLVLLIPIQVISCSAAGSGKFNSFILNSIPVLVTVASFGVYSLLGGDLTPAKAFTSLSLFSVLRFPLFMLPNLITQV